MASSFRASELDTIVEATSIESASTPPTTIRSVGLMSTASSPIALPPPLRPKDIGGKKVEDVREQPARDAPRGLLSKVPWPLNPHYRAESPPASHSPSPKHSRHSSHSNTSSHRRNSSGGSSSPPQPRPHRNSLPPSITTSPPVLPSEYSDQEQDSHPSFSRSTNTASAALTLLRQYSPSVADYVEAKQAGKLPSSSTIPSAVESSYQSPLTTGGHLTVERPGTPVVDFPRQSFESTTVESPLKEKGRKRSVSVLSGESVAGEEARFRVSGTFGVRDRVASESEAKEDPTTVSAPPPISESEGEDNDKPTQASVSKTIDKPSASKPPSIIVNRNNGAAHARTNSASDAELSEIFPGSYSWAQAGLPSPGGSAVFVHTYIEGAQGSGSGRLRRSWTAPSKLRLDSLTEDSTGGEQGVERKVKRETIDSISSSKGGGLPDLAESPLQVPRPTSTPQIPSTNNHTATESIPNPSNNRHPHRRLSRRRTRSETPLLYASSVISKHAAILMEEKKRNSLQMRQMAKESLVIGKLLLEMAGSDEDNEDHFGGDSGGARVGGSSSGGEVIERLRADKEGEELLGIGLDSPPFHTRTPLSGLSESHAASQAEQNRKDAFDALNGVLNPSSDPLQVLQSAQAKQTRPQSLPSTPTWAEIESLAKSGFAKLREAEELFLLSIEKGRRFEEQLDRLAMGERGSIRGSRSGSPVDGSVNGSSLSRRGSKLHKAQPRKPRTNGGPGPMSPRPSSIMRGRTDSGLGAAGGPSREGSPTKAQQQVRFQQDQLRGLSGEAEKRKRRWFGLRRAK